MEKLSPHSKLSPSQNTTFTKTCPDEPEGCHQESSGSPELSWENTCWGTSQRESFALPLPKALGQDLGFHSFLRKLKSRSSWLPSEKVWMWEVDIVYWEVDIDRAVYMIMMTSAGLE